MANTRIFIADDHPLMREGLRSVLELQEDFEICGEHDRMEGLFDSIREAKPDILILDLAFPDGTGRDLVTHMRSQGDETPILIISSHDEETYAEALIQDGANGYVMKDEATKQIIRGLRTILDGNVFLSEAMQRIVINQLRGGRIKRGRVKRSKNHPLAALTQREGEIFHLIGQGLASKEIGERLSISVSTVDVHKSRIRAKLKLSDAPELLRYALTHAGRVTA